MNITTTRFGDQSIADDAILSFPEGLPGFNSRRFTLIPDAQSSRVQWLQSLDEPAVALMTVLPADLELEYQAKPKRAEIYPIKPEGVDDDEITVRVIVSKGEDDGQLLVNLFAPIMLNLVRKLGMQIPLVGSGYSLREVWPAPKSAE